jgi:hypothetical protein
MKLFVSYAFGAYRDAFCTGLLPFGGHQQGGIALGISIGLRGHRGGDQTVAVLDQCMTEIRQLRFFAIALFIGTRLRIGGRLMGLVRALLPMEVRTVTIVRTILLAEALL